MHKRFLPWKNTVQQCPMDDNSQGTVKGVSLHQTVNLTSHGLESDYQVHDEEVITLAIRGDNLSISKQLSLIMRR